MLRVFGRLFQRDLARSFHAVRCSGVLPEASGPLVVFANHPSWWDGEIFVWLTTTVFRDRRVFTPADPAMLAHYRFFSKLGAFAVGLDYAGAATLLAVGEAVLAEDDGLLLINAEGRFRDVRDRPLQIASSLSHLAKRVPTATFVPLAIEYAFWDERRPNLLLRFGDALTALSARENGALQQALAETMNALAVDTASRDPARFTTLLAGRSAINPFYDGWRRAKAVLKGRRFALGHRAGLGRP